MASADLRQIVVTEFENPVVLMKTEDPSLWSDLIAQLKQLEFQVEVQDQVVEVESKGRSVVWLVDDASVGNTFTDPFVVISKLGSIANVATALDCGAAAFFVWPVEIFGLIAAIRAAERRRAELTRMTEQTVNLRALLTTENGISTAVGLLMERCHLRREDAAKRLRGYARRNRKKLSEVANQLLAEADHLSELVTVVKGVGQEI